jgi:hypothetical protein
VVALIVLLAGCGNAPSPGTTCGHGVLEAGEECDGVDLAGHTCATEGFAGGSLDCQPIFTARCATSRLCHLTSPHTYLSLHEGEAYDQLVNAQAAETEVEVRVKPFHPEDSWLMDKITANQTTLMPAIGGALPTDQIELIREWILQGALDN